MRWIYWIGVPYVVIDLLDVSSRIGPAVAFYSNDNDRHKLKAPLLWELLSDARLIRGEDTHDERDTQP